MLALLNVMRDMAGEALDALDRDDSVAARDALTAMLHTISRAEG